MLKSTGGEFRGGSISLWEISYFKCVRNFLLNFQAAVRNKPGAKFSHWGFAGFAGGMLLASPLPPFRELLGFTRCSTRLSLFLPSMYPKALRIVDELKNRRALGVVPQKQASKRPLDASMFLDLRKKRHRKEARK